MDVDQDDIRIDLVRFLPREIVEEIFLHLTPIDLAACSLVSTMWREATNSDKVWGILCKKHGWNDDLDPHFSHFCRAHKQFRRWTSDNSLSPMCDKRLRFNKHSFLQSNWRYGKFMIQKIFNGARGTLQLFDPVSCDGQYLVIQESRPCLQFGLTWNLQVWSLDGVPSQVCTLPLPSKAHSVESIAFDYGTIAVAQEWIIVVYHLKDNTFEKSFEKEELSILELKTRLPEDVKRTKIHLKITQDYMICVPNHSHSTVDYIPIFFWDRISGELKHTLSFDSMYYEIPNAVWFGDSCFLSLTDKENRSYQVVEFGMKSAAWEAFSQSVTMEVEQVVVGEYYVLAVTENSNLAYHFQYTGNKKLWLWDRTTGSALKTLVTQGYGFQFVDDFLVYFDYTQVTVMNPKDLSLCSKFEVSGIICSIRAANHPGLIVIRNTSGCIEVWDWGLGSRLYTIRGEAGYSSQLWCDDKRIITFHSYCIILVLGFW